MKRKAPVIGVLGGSFNPAHLGHVLAAVYALKQFELDQVWFVPAYQHAFGKPLLPFKHRMAICKLLLQNMGTHFRANAVDQQIKNLGRTLYTLEALKKKHPSYRFHWIIGSDLLKETKSWYQVEKIKRNFGFLVVPRGIDASKNISIPNINSTNIRKSLSTKKIPDGLTPSIFNYIQKNKLYCP